MKHKKKEKRRSRLCAGNHRLLNLFKRKIKSNSFGWIEGLERKIISFFQNIVLSYFFKCILINRTTTQQNKCFFSKTLKCAISTHHCYLNTKFYNEMYRSFTTIHNLIISFKIITSLYRSSLSTKYFDCVFNCTLNIYDYLE